MPFELPKPPRLSLGGSTKTLVELELDTGDIETEKWKEVSELVSRVPGIIGKFHDLQNRSKASKALASRIYAELKKEEKLPTIDDIPQSNTGFGANLSMLTRQEDAVARDSVLKDMAAQKDRALRDEASAIVADPELVKQYLGLLEKRWTQRDKEATQKELADLRFEHSKLLIGARKEATKEILGTKADLKAKEPPKLPQEALKRKDALIGTELFINGLRAQYNALAAAGYIGPVMGRGHSLFAAITGGGSNPALKEYNDTIAGFTTSLKALAGQSGQFAVQEINWMKGLLAAASIDPKTGDNKYQAILNHIGFKKKALAQTYKGISFDDAPKSSDSTNDDLEEEGL